MMSWNGMGQKISDATKNTLLTGAGVGLGGLINSRSYTLNSKKEHLYGNVYIDPSNYNDFSLRVLRKLGKAYEDKDIAKIYSIWNIIYQNPEGRFNMNYGKIHNTVNMMNNYFNTQTKDNNLVSQKGFMKCNNLFIDPKSLNDDNQDEYNSLTEAITMEIANNKNCDIQYQRNNDIDLEYPNLGFQVNNDCIFVLRLVEKDGMFRLKLEKMRQQGIAIEQDSKSEFGCNLYLIASDKKDIILSEEEKKTVLDFITQIASENPQIFKNYQNSPEFLEFKSTGKLNALTNSNYPFPKAITNFDCRKLFKISDIKNNKDFKDILDEMEKDKTGRSGNITITLDSNDDN